MIIIFTRGRTFSLNIGGTIGMIFSFNERGRSINLYDWQLGRKIYERAANIKSIIMYLKKEGFINKEEPSELRYNYTLTDEGYFRLQLMLVDESVRIEL
jgi:uncharacterized membrane-anchored protein